MTNVLGNAYVVLTGAANPGNNTITVPPEKLQNGGTQNRDLRTSQHPSTRTDNRHGE